MMWKPLFAGLVLLLLSKNGVNAIPACPPMEHGASNGVIMECSHPIFTLYENSECTFSCAEGALNGAPHLVCKCEQGICRFEKDNMKFQEWGFAHSCTGWKEQQVTTSTSASVSVSSVPSWLRDLVGDDGINIDEQSAEVERTLSVEAADDVCAALNTPSHGGTWSCSDTNSDGSTCTLNCPVGYKVSDPSAKDKSCACSSDYDGPIVIDLGCSWDNTDSVDCEEDDQFVDSCIPLSAPENGTMTCTDSFNEGTACSFYCDDITALVYPAKSSKRKCKCGKNGCFWTRSDNYCGPPPMTPECSALPAMTNIYTELACDNGANHASTCSFVCDAGFRLNIGGHGSRCKCLRRRGNYACNWTRELETRHCVPAPRWYRQWKRRYNRAKRLGETDMLVDYITEYNEVSVWADANLSEQLTYETRRRRSISQTTLSMMSALLHSPHA